AAFVVAMVLVCLGMRRVPLARRQRPSLFFLAMTFFVMALGAASCTPPDKAKSTNQARVAAKSASPFPPELASPEKWAQFKALWEEINAVEPKFQKDGKSLGEESQSYGRTITAEQAHAWEKKLASCLGLDSAQQMRMAVTRTYQQLGSQEWKGKPDAKTLSIPMLALANVTLDRIKYMQQGDKTKKIRMAMPAIQRHATLMENLEKRIDTLAALRKKGIIKGKEFITARQAIQNDIYLHAVLGAFDGKPQPWPYRPIVKPVNFDYRMAMPPDKVVMPREVHKKLAEVDQRIAKLEALKQKGTIKAPEYAISIAKLKKEKRDLTYFDPEAWIDGYKQAIDYYINQPPAKQEQVRKSPRIEKEKYRQAYRQVRAVFDQLQKNRPMVDAAVKELEKSG
ncbi:MAG: hypothetical protein K8S55_11340, partial [Phycisphaerae bacterium]|nr:hypothetical protein [Phycisphaerae bacterium]